MEARRYQLSAWQLSFTKKVFSATKEAFETADALREKRERLQTEFFLWRRGQEVFGLALVDHPKHSFGTTEVKFPTTSYDGLQILVARINQALPNLLPEYKAISGRIFRFLAKKREIVREVTKGWDVDPLIKGFAIIPRFQLEARIAEPLPGHLIAILVASVRMHYQISADLVQLQDAGVVLRGLHVIRRPSGTQESTYAGRISDAEEKRIVLFDAKEGDEEALPSDLMLEGARQTLALAYRQFFDRALAHLRKSVIN